jgi:hypothetical protein
MKKSVVVFVVLVMLLAFTIPAAAGGNGPGNSNGQGKGPNMDPVVTPEIGTGPGPETSAGPGPMTSAGPGPMTNLGTGLMTAARQGPGPMDAFSLTGTIAEIGTGSVTINVLHGSKLAQRVIGTALSIAVTDQTRYVYNDGTLPTLITFADLVVDDPVSVRGLVIDGVWTATRITVGAALVHVP